mgnify:CR=1 FL=1
MSPDRTCNDDLFLEKDIKTMVMLSRKAMMGAQGGGVSLPLNIDFNTLEDGPLPAPLTGTTWTVSGGRAVNTPTAGENVLTGGDMEDDPVTYWPATGTPATREKSDAQAHGGTYSLHLVTDGVNEGVSKNIAATPGRFYRFSSFLRRASG